MPRANRNEGGIGITGTAQVEARETPSERMRRGLREMMHPEVGPATRARPVIDYFAIDPGDPYEEWMDHDMSNPYTRRRRPATTSDQVIYESTSGFRVRYGERDGEGYFLFGAYGDDVVLTPSNTVAMARALVEFFQQKYGGEPCNENEDSVAGQSPE
jgi:hypothetical protein